MMMQAKYDARNNWIQERIYQLASVKNALFSSSTLPSGYDINSTREKYWKAVVDYSSSITTVDFADDNKFRNIQSNYDRIEKYFYDSYNQLMSSYSENEMLKTSNPETTGKISFWTNIKRSGNMNVYLDGNYIGTLSSYFDEGTPACGQHGTITVSRAPGTYNFYAVSEGSFSTKTWKGTITVTAGGCSLQGLVKK